MKKLFGNKKTYTNKQLEQIKAYYMFAVSATCTFVAFGGTMAALKLSGSDIDMVQCNGCIAYAMVCGIMSFICSKVYKRAKNEKMRDIVDSEFRLMNQMEYQGEKKACGLKSQVFLYEQKPPV